MAKQREGLVETDMESIAPRFAELGLSEPRGLCILPINFFGADGQTDLYLHPQMPDFKVLLRQAGVPLDNIVPDGVKIPYRNDHDSTLVVPTLFLGAAYLSGNANLLNVALGVVANYVTDYFRGQGGVKRVECTVLIEKTEKKTVKRIEYSGSPDEFAKLIEAIKTTLE